MRRHSYLRAHCIHGGAADEPPRAARGSERGGGGWGWGRCGEVGAGVGAAGAGAAGASDGRSQRRQGHRRQGRRRPALDAQPRAETRHNHTNVGDLSRLCAVCRYIRLNCAIGESLLRDCAFRAAYGGSRPQPSFSAHEGTFCAACRPQPQPAAVCYLSSARVRSSRCALARARGRWPCLRPEMPARDG